MLMDAYAKNKRIPHTLIKRYLPLNKKMQIAKERASNAPLMAMAILRSVIHIDAIVAVVSFAVV